MNFSNLVNYYITESDFGLFSFGCWHGTHEARMVLVGLKSDQINFFFQFALTKRRRFVIWSKKKIGKIKIRVHTILEEQNKEEERGRQRRWDVP